MIQLSTRRLQCKAAPTRHFRIDSPSSTLEVYPESIYLRLWAAHQAERYQDLLRTITAAPKPVRED